MPDESAPAGRGGNRGSKGIALVQDGQRVILHGHVSVEVAERIWTRTLEAWEVHGTTEQIRSSIIVALAETVIQGTSVAADLEALCIIVDGVTCPLVTLAVEAGKHTSQANPIRVFYRSFRQAVIPCTTYRILLEPSNIQQRKLAMIKYGCTGDKVHCAFDMYTDAAPHLEQSDFDLLTGRSINGSFLRMQDSERRERGQTFTPQDTTSKQAEGLSAAAAPIPTSRGERLGFAPLR